MTKWIGVLVFPVGMAHAQVAFTEVAGPSGINCQYAFPQNFDPNGRMTAGGAVGDFDRDGDQDVFVLSGGHAPDVLLINDGTGHFTDQAAAWGVARSHIGAGVAVGDVNGDGWLDVFVTSHGPAGDPGTPGHHLLYINTGGDGFVESAAQAGVKQTTIVEADGFGASFGDYDLDGDLDLAVSGWVRGSGGNKLFQNDGHGVFTDVTATAILTDLTPAQGFSPRFQDMNGDRYPELLWVSDFMSSRYLVNNTDGTFSEATASSGTGLDSNGMGTTVADFDGDGRPDWYVCSIQSGDDVGIRPEYSGNKLYHNLGNHVFDEISELVNVNTGGWAWGADAQDYDQDGDADLAWTNGWLTYPIWQTDPSYLALNDGTGGFTIAPMLTINHSAQGRGLLTFDADGDGDRDIMIFSTDVPTALFRNELPAGANAHWLRVRLDTIAAPGLAPDGVGTEVVVTAGGRMMHRWVSASTNYLAQSELSAHFGLGAASVVDRLEVRWGDGGVTVLEGVGANQSITVVAGCPADVNGDGMLTGADFNAWLGAFLARDLIADQNRDGSFSGADFNAFITAFAGGCG